MIRLCGFSVATTIDLAAVLISLCPALWSIAQNTAETMWKGGLEECTSGKISRIEAHLKEGGEIWIGADDADHRVTAVIQHGGAEHLRTTKVGGLLSAKTTGEGGPDLINRLNRDKKVYMARDGAQHETLLTVKFYRFVRKKNEPAPAELVDQHGLV